MNELATKKCIPCSGGIPALQGDEIKDYLYKLGPGWNVIVEHHLEKEFIFNDFKEALAFTNRIGNMAEEQGHHPNIYLQWGKVKIIVWTHKVDGLTESDFIFAAKTDELY